METTDCSVTTLQNLSLMSQPPSPSALTIPDSNLPRMRGKTKHVIDK
jgi:hypothetical protein